LLKPEWLAKAENFSRMYTQKKIFHIYKLFKSSFKDKIIYKLKIQEFLVYKNNQNAYLIKKVYGNKTISQRLYIWLNKQEILVKQNQIHNLNEFFNDLDKLINSIYLNGLSWHIYTNLQKHCLYKDVYFAYHSSQFQYLSNALDIHMIIMYFCIYIYTKSVNLKELRSYLYCNINSCININNINIKTRTNVRNIIKPNRKLVQHTISTLRSKLYHRNSKGAWRVNQIIKVNQVTSLGRHLLDQLNLNYLQDLNPLEKEKLINTIGRQIYLWQKKNNR
jgi:hypothetical protein